MTSGIDFAYGFSHRFLKFFLSQNFCFTIDLIPMAFDTSMICEESDSAYLWRIRFYLSVKFIIELSENLRRKNEHLKCTIL